MNNIYLVMERSDRDQRYRVVVATTQPKAYETAQQLNDAAQQDGFAGLSYFVQPVPSAGLRAQCDHNNLSETYTEQVCYCEDCNATVAV